MLKIGITGGIGSGKTTVCKIYSQLSIPVFDADTSAKRLMNSDVELISNLKKEFGVKIYNGKNKLNKKYIAHLIFNDESALKKINSLVHPAVKKDFDKWINKFEAAPYVIQEAAILFESGVNKNMDYVITITAPEHLRFRRVMMRDNVSQDYIKSISKNQLEEKEKIKMSDFEIVNDDQQLLIPQVLKLHAHFLSLANK